jgi:hypothetical protein
MTDLVVSNCKAAFLRNNFAGDAPQSALKFIAPKFNTLKFNFVTGPLD